MELDFYNDDIKRLTNKDLKSIPKKQQYYRDINNNNSDDDDDIPTNLLIGIKRGKSSFDIDELKKQRKREKNPKKIPREDGRDWPDPFGEEEGGYYEEKWRTEEEARREILESHPDYQFITLVAGSANTTVEQLFEEGDILSIFRREQALMRQQRLALEEVKASTKDVERDVNNLTIELNQLRNTRNVGKNLVIQIQQWYSSFGDYESQYVHAKNLLERLKRKTKIMKIYQTIEPKSEQTFKLRLKEFKKDLITEAKIFKNEKLLQNGDLIENVKNSEDIKELTETLIFIWFSIDDKDGYENYIITQDISEKQDILKTYLNTEITVNIRKDTNEKENELKKNKEKILVRFFDIIFFLEDNNILAIDKKDIFITPDKKKTYDQDLALNLYKKYGGVTLKKPDDTDVNIRDFITTEFSQIANEIGLLNGIYLQNPKKLTEKEKVIMKIYDDAIYTGPYLNEMNAYRAWLSIQLIRIEKSIEKVEEQLESSRERLSRLRLGEVTFKDIEQPYRHRRGWVERPENSGIVRIKPIVVSAIDDAFKMIQLWTDYGKKVDVEFVQHDEEIRNDFAKLVAIKMSFSIVRFPKQYLSNVLRSFAKQDQFDIVNRLKHSYKIIIDPKKSTFGNPKFKAIILGKTDRIENPYLQEKERFFIFN